MYHSQSAVQAKLRRLFPPALGQGGRWPERWQTSAQIELIPSDRRARRKQNLVYWLWELMSRVHWMKKNFYVGNDHKFRSFLCLHTI